MAGFIDELTKWEEEAKFWRDEGGKAGVEVTKAEGALPWWLKVLGWGKVLPAITGAGSTLPRVLFPAITGKPLPPEVLDPLKAIDVLTAQEKYGTWTDTVDKANRADFFATLYRTAPTGIALGKITSFEDFIAQLGGVSEGTLSSEDMAEARSIINQMIAAGGVPAEGPEWLEVAPAEERAVTEFLTTPMETKPRFTGVHVTTVEEITKWLQKEIPAPELPLGMTDVGLLNTAKSMGLTEEQVNIAADYDEMMGIIGEVWAEQQQLVDDVKAGRAEYDMPRLEGAELAKYIALQPLQAVADMVSPYLEHVNYPMAGWAIHNVSEISPITGIFVPEGTWGYDELYERSRATNNWWNAHAMAWESWDVNWGAKLAVEIAVDPLTYVGLGVYPRVFATFGKFGRAVAASERWFNYASDIPFQFIKNQWARIPRVPSQVMRAENERFIAVMDAAVRGHVARTKGVAKTAQQLTKDDIMDAVTFSIEHYRTSPDLAVRGTDDFYAEFGRYLTDTAPITPAQTLAWSEAVDGKLILSDITNRTLDDVNNIVYDLLAGKGSVAEHTPNMLFKLMAESTEATQRRIKLILNRQISQYAKRIERLAALEDPGEIVVAMSAQQRKILDAQVRSQFFRTRSEHGMVAALMGHVSHMESTLWRNVLDRYAVRPMAEAYLGFSGYPIWNAFEDMFRSSVEGVLPRQMSLEHMQLLNVGINAREARLLTGGASDVRGMLGTLPGREGLISFLPGKLPEAVTTRVPLLGKTIGGAQFTEWLGRHWIELSNVWGNAFRRNFVGRKYLHYLAEFGRDFQGKDVTKLIDDAITKAGKQPEIRGIKPNELRNEIAARVQTGHRDVVLDLKKAINNNSLMQQEQRKILQQAAELTPQARTLAEQMVATGEALDNPNAYCKAVADQAVADIKTYPAQVVENFEYMATKIVGESITTPDEIMQAFQHLTVMQDTAGCIPHRLMAKTHEISDDLMAKGKYGKVVDQLWRKERTEMFDVMDRISAANDKVRQKILDAIPEVGLTPNQQSALRELLSHTNIRDSLKTSAMMDDGDLLDVFWAKSKAERTKEAYQALRADRFELWEAYRIADADYFGNEFIMRKSYQELHYKMPKRPPLSVDASSRVLVPNDIARILDSNVDGVSKEIVENVAFQDRYHFTKLIRKLADSNPTAFKGFTEDKIHQVYNVILDNMRLTPDMDIQVQKVLMQTEGIRQEMIILKQTKAMTPAEEKEFSSWVDRIATNMDGLPIYKKPVVEMPPIVPEVPPTKPLVGKAPRLFQYVGGKSELAPQILPELGYVTGNIIDPFFGSGAVPFGVRKSGNLGGRIIAQEANTDMVKLYRIAKEHPDELIAGVKSLYGTEGIDKARATAIRDTFNSGVGTEMERAAQWLVISRHSFGGFIQYDKGMKITGAMVDKTLKWTGQFDDALREGIEAAKYVDVTKATKDSYLDMIRAAKPGDVIYLDPPYSGRAKRLVYPGEREVGAWTSEDLTAMLDAAKDAANKGVRVVISESADVGDALKAIGASIKEVTIPKGAAIRGELRAEIVATLEAKPPVKPPTKPVVEVPIIPEEAVPLVRDAYEAQSIREILDPIGSRIKTGEDWAPTLSDAVERWYRNPHDEYLQLIGETASKNKEYMGEVHRILLNKYPSGRIRVFRGPGQAGRFGKRPTDREFINVTSDYNVAKEFAEGKEPLEAAVSVGDVVAVSSAGESELIIPSSVIREYLEHPIKPPAKPPVKPPTKPVAPEVMDEWTQLRQRSWDEGLKDYYKAFTDYSHENIIDHVMRHIFPYWTYEVQRWFFIPRTFIRRPGTLMAWGKYNEYSEHGYVPIPGTDLQVNLARGSVFGLTFGLTRRDYPYHYQQLGPMAEVTDALMRFGFYPGIHFMLPIVTTPAFTGRPPNWGESLPALYKTGINVLATSPIPKVSESALWLQDHVFHDNFRDYQVVTKIDEMQVKAGGTLIGGQTGQDLWDKRMAGDWGISADERRNMEIKLEGGLLTPEEIEAWEEKKRLADEEETVWNEAARYRAWLGLLMENIPVFRYRPEEQVEAFKRVTELIEAQTGLTAEQQDYLWKHNLRPSDVCPAIMSPSLRRAMNEMWEYKLFLGRSTVIKPQRWSELDMKTSKFWKQVDTYQQERRARQEEINVGFLTPTTVLHFTGREWIEQKAANWNTYMGRYDDLKKSDEYAEVAITLEERAAQLQEQGFPAPTASMFDEALRLYFQVKPEVVRNKYTGEEDIDWATFHLKREAIIKGLPPTQQEEFTTYIRAYETPLERRFREICNTYFRGYWAVTNIILNQYSESEKALIAGYYSDLTTHARREEIQAYVRETGRQLISEYTSRLSDARIKLRTVSPTLDYYLTIFGYVSVPRTEEAKAMVYAFDKDRMVLVL